MSAFDAAVKHAGAEVIALVRAKNTSYGDSIGRSARMLTLLFPDGIHPDLYDRLHFIVRMLDKLCRLSSLELSQKAEEDAWSDLAGYALAALVQSKRRS